MAATAAAVMAGAPLAAYAAAVVAATAVTTTRPAQAALIPSVAATPDQLTAVNVVVGWLEATGLAVAGLLAGVLILVAGAQRRAGGARTRAWCGRHLLAAAGASNALLEIATRTLLQRSVPPQLIGRIFGLLEGSRWLGTRSARCWCRCLFTWEAAGSRCWESQPCCRWRPRSAAAPCSAWTPRPPCRLWR